jgi:Acetyltransferase (GNAT) domain
VKSTASADGGVSAARGRLWLDELLIRTPRAIDPVLRAGRPWLAALSGFRLPIQILRGRGADGVERSVLVAGRGALLNLLIARFFIEEPVRVLAARSGPQQWRTRLTARLGEFDLVMAVAPRPLAGLLSGSRLLRVPTAVEFTSDAAAALDLSRARLSLRASVRRLHAAGFTARLARDPGDLERFYREFYLPMLARRFGNKSHPISMLTLRRRVRAGGLIWLDHGGRTVAGEVFEIRGDTVRLLVHGRHPTGDPKLDALVQLAADRAAMEEGYRRGCRTVDLGAALPLPGSGLFARKRAYGGTVRARASATRELVIGWQRAGPALAALLNRAPLVIRRGERLEALTALEAAGQADPRAAARLYHALLPDGIERLTVLATEGWLPPARGCSIPGPEVLRLTGPVGSADLTTSASVTG